MNKSAAKKTLIASTAAVALSTMLFAGTTLAWFTDSVSSGISTVQSGNLDVVFEVFNADEGESGEWQEIDGTTDIFHLSESESKDLWEPGHVETAYVRVKNNGSLALKYELDMTAKATAFTNVDGNETSLAKYIDFGIEKTDGFTQYTDRDKAAAGAQTVDITWSEDTSPSGSAKVTEGSLNPGEDAYDYYVISAVMPTSVTNEANWNGEDTQPSISFQLFLTAAQQQLESDSFDNTYDADVKVDRTQFLKNQGYKTFEGGELSTAAQNGSVVLSGDVTKDKSYVNSDYVVDLNGNTITVTQSYRVQQAETVYLSNGTYQFTDASSDNSIVNIYPKNVENPTVIFENMHFISTKTDENSQYTKVMTAIAVMLDETKNVEVHFINCTFDQTTLLFNPARNTCNIQASFENCTFNLANDSTSSISAVGFGNYLTGNIDFSECVFNINSNVTTKAISINAFNTGLTVNIDDKTVLNNLNENVSVSLK
jgi:predicted ribosomally synthesized peptide with SipW-like signal peptide